MVKGYLLALCIYFRFTLYMDRGQAKVSSEIVWSVQTLYSLVSAFQGFICLVSELNAALACLTERRKLNWIKSFSPRVAFIGRFKNILFRIHYIDFCEASDCKRVGCMFDSRSFQLIILLSSRCVSVGVEFRHS